MEALEADGMPDFEKIHADRDTCLTDAENKCKSACEAAGDDDCDDVCSLIV